MRTTLNIDDDLYALAVELTGVHEKTALVRESLLAPVERESAKRLALWGDSEPEFTSIPRRQSGKLIK